MKLGCAQTKKTAQTQVNPCVYALLGPKLKPTLRPEAAFFGLVSPTTSNQRLCFHKTHLKTCSLRAHEIKKH